jgi:hypothetical protein
MDQMKDWLGLVALVVSVGGTFYAWITAGSKTNAADLSNFKKAHTEKVDAIETALDAHDRRIQTVETEMKHLPDKDSVVELKLAMSDLKGTVGRLDESLNSVQRTVLRIDDWLRTDRAK